MRQEFIGKKRNPHKLFENTNSPLAVPANLRRRGTHATFGHSKRGTDPLP